MWPVTGRGGSISYLIDSECTPSLGPRLICHRWITTEGGNKEVGIATIELSGKCPCSSMQGMDMQDSQFSDNFISCQV